MANVYDDIDLTEGVADLAANTDRIALFDSTGTRVGTVYATPNWGNPVLSGSGGARKATVTSTELTITVPAGVASVGQQITHYARMSGNTRRALIDLEPVSIVVNRSDMPFDVRVTPSIEYNPVE